MHGVSGVLLAIIIASGTLPLPIVPTPVPIPPTIAPTLVPTIAPRPQCGAAFSYPRLGICASIGAYADSSGASGIGSGVVQLTAITSGIWLAGHAWTQMGRIVGWAPGDVAYVYGHAYQMAYATTEQCGTPPSVVTPINLQTSLTSTCGPVLVVHGH